jgi:hypothetical protein
MKLTGKDSKLPYAKNIKNGNDSAKIYLNSKTTNGQLLVIET